MPHYHVDPEVAAEYAEMSGEELPDDFDGDSYEPAETIIDFGKLDEQDRRIRDVLVARGYDHVACTYDGGYDEGFAYFESARSESSAVGVEQLSQQAADDFVGPAPTFSLPGPMPPEVREQLRKQHEEMPHPARAKQLLDDFADTLASKLLGSGFGTGEMTLRGRFRCDLNTGRIVDVEENPPEPRMGVR